MLLQMEIDIKTFGFLIPIFNSALDVEGSLQDKTCNSAEYKHNSTIALIEMALYKLSQ